MNVMDALTTKQRTLLQRIGLVSWVGFAVGHNFNFFNDAFP